MNRFVAVLAARVCALVPGGRDKPSRSRTRTTRQLPSLPDRGGLKQQGVDLKPDVLLRASGRDGASGQDLMGFEAGSRPDRSEAQGGDRRAPEADGGA